MLGALRAVVACALLPHHRMHLPRLIGVSQRAGRPGGAGRSTAELAPRRKRTSSGHPSDPLIQEGSAWSLPAADLGGVSAQCGNRYGSRFP